MTKKRTEKTQDEVLADFDRERQPYLELMRSLDDLDTAREYKDRKLKRAKEIIDGILSVTTGNAVVTEANNEWGHGSLVELFKMLSVRHENFPTFDFMEDLQTYIFHWTLTHDDTYRNWRENALAERGLDKFGVDLEQKKVRKVLDMSGSTTEDLARKLSDIMHNPNLPAKIFNCLADELTELPDAHTPEIILHNLKGLQSEEE